MRHRSRQTPLVFLSISYHDNQYQGRFSRRLAARLEMTHEPVLIRVNNNSHSVIVTGEYDGQFTVVDPGDQTKTLLFQYSNWLIDGWIGDPSDVSSLHIRSGSWWRRCGSYGDGSIRRANRQ